MIAEGACARDFPEATWSHQCHECSNVDFEPVEQKKPENEEEPDIALAVVIAIAATTGLAVIVIVGCLWRMRRKLFGGSGTASDVAVVVGKPVHDDDPGSEKA
jgi:hypothetical protein